MGEGSPLLSQSHRYADRDPDLSYAQYFKTSQSQSISCTLSVGTFSKHASQESSFVSHCFLKLSAMTMMSRGSQQRPFINSQSKFQHAHGREEEKVYLHRANTVLLLSNLTLVS